MGGFLWLRLFFWFMLAMLALGSFYFIPSPNLQTIEVFERLWAVEN